LFWSQRLFIGWFDRQLFPWFKRKKSRLTVKLSLIPFDFIVVYVFLLLTTAY
jgi:uncharacterized membrane protein (DUF485 family)